MLLRALLVCGSALPLAFGADDSAPRISLERALDAGWQEAVVLTADIARLEQFAAEVAGWRVLARGEAHASVTQRYGLPNPSRELLIGDADAHPGLIRVIEALAPGAVSIRAAAQPWDTGGIMSLMVRSNDTAGMFAAAERLGWNAFNAPVDFDFGTVKLRNVVVRGPDGVAISVYERLTPRMPDDADLRRLRRPFNSMQSVRDIGAARDFYTRVLEFEVVNAGEFVNPKRAPNNFGMPANLVIANPVDFAIFAPRRDSPAAIETVQLRGAEGRDVSALAMPPNRGITSLRFPVGRLSAIEARLSAANYPPTTPTARALIEPYGEVLMLGVRSPDGALLEFFQTVQAPP